MNRRAFLAALGAFAAPVAAEAQQSGRVFTIGYLSRGIPGTRTHAAFQQGLRDVGYEDGKNVFVHYRFARGSQERLEEFAAELVGMNVHVIVATGAGTTAAQRATSTIPVVFMGVTDPIGAGYVKSLARPGGNLTGLTYAGVELNPKRLDLLKELLPHATRFAALAASVHRLYGRMIEQLDAAARSLRVQLQVVDGAEATTAGLETAFETINRGRPHGVLVLQYDLFVQRRQQIAELAAKHRLPAMYELREFVEAGGLISYAANLTHQYHRASIYVDKILKGAKPANLPVEQPTKFELVINLKTAKALGLTIPPALLLRADQVIE